MEKLSKQQACDVLSAWLALEVLSTQSFRKHEDLTGGDKSSIYFLSDKKLPWENGGEKPRPHTKIFYQVIIGTIDLRKAFLALSQVYGDTYSEASTTSGEAIIGTITVDQYGYPLKSKSSISIASFAWGLPEALKGNLKDLDKWSTIEAEVSAAIWETIKRTDENYHPPRPKPKTDLKIQPTIKELEPADCEDQECSNLENLTPSSPEGPLQRMTNSFAKDQPLNKVFFKAAAEYLVKTFDIPLEMVIDKQFSIRTYEPVKKEGVPQGLLLNSFYLDDLLQAKDLIRYHTLHKKDSKNILKYVGVEPPLERYNLLTDNSTLESIISPQNTPCARWPSEGRHPLVLLQQAAVNLAMTKLKGNGILGVNGPPGTGKTTLLRDIIAEVVSNRAEALSRFNDPQDAFFTSYKKVKLGQSYLQFHRLDGRLKGFEILIASSNNKAVENITTELPSIKSIAKDTKGLRYFNTLSDFLLEEKTWGLISAVLGNAKNRNHFRQKFWWDREFGLSTYLAEATGFPQLLDMKDPNSGKIIGQRKPKIILENSPPSNHTEALEHWQQERNSFIKILLKVRKKLLDLEGIRKEVIELQEIETLLASPPPHQPGFISRLLNTSSAQKWNEYIAKVSLWEELTKKVAVFSEALGDGLINKKLFLKSHQDFHQISPWCDAHTQTLREEVFISSIKLHKAFIDAAAKPLRHNLGLLMQTFSDPSEIITTENKHYLADLWSSLFLVVPSISTTFSSIRTMLKDLPANSLGWLLIDEGGQALPQAAVGAIMRAKRIVVTGDPLQIEPIVTLPKNLTREICKQFGVESARFNAPEASVQTLADEASSYFAEFQTRYGNRTVGVPLLVHRRCAEPMFSISNIIAYERLMVSAKSQNKSMIRECLGPSTWFHILGGSLDKWCPEEGKKVLELLKKLKENLVPPSLYIVTPFKIVANNLRKIIIESNILKSWVHDSYLWTLEHVGTVHTLQGREAEAVILVLGAQDVSQGGARNWAGQFPNMLNVAVTRAKEVIYVVGNKSLWSEVGVFKELHDRINIAS